MAGLPWVDGLFAVASALVALYSASRLALARRAGDAPGVSAELTHVLMAAGMAAMFVPSVDPFPRTVWIGVFVINGAWLVAALPRAAAVAGGVFGPAQRYRLHLVISTVAMVYMFAAMGTQAVQTPAVALPASGAAVLAHDHGAGGGMNLAPLTVGFAAYFLAYTVWSARSVVRVSAHSGRTNVLTLPRLLSGPRLTGVCHVVMGLGMSSMFATMVG